MEQGLTSHQTHYRSYRGRFLQVIWPNQQCHSTEENQLVLQIRLESHQDQPEIHHGCIAANSVQRVMLFLLCLRVGTEFETLSPLASLQNVLTFLYTIIFTLANTDTLLHYTVHIMLHRLIDLILEFCWFISCVCSWWSPSLM